MRFIKTAVIQARAVYPPVSAWEFESLKTEAAVKERLSNSTIYMIVQRPMLWFQDVIQRDGFLHFDIVDGTGKCVHCKFDPRVVLGIPGESGIDVDFGFHQDDNQVAEPYKYVASIRIYQDGEFLAWWSPHKLMFEASTRNLPLLGAGDRDAFIDYDVHYIGQAFSQTVWDRLTGHTKVQSVLSSEFVRGDRVPSAALEISLITLEIFGVTEAAFDASIPFEMPEGITPILHELSNEDVGNSAKLHTIWMAPEDTEATNELEAMLINMFDPSYNQVKFRNYPLIKKGARSKGYSYCELFLTDFPFKLRAQDGNEPLQDV